MTKDEKWIHEHFEELVDNYAGQYVAVARGDMFVGSSLREAKDKAQQKFPGHSPSILRVPSAEDFTCAP